MKCWICEMAKGDKTSCCQTLCKRHEEEARKSAASYNINFEEAVNQLGWSVWEEA